MVLSRHTKQSATSYADKLNGAVVKGQYLPQNLKFSDFCKTITRFVSV